MNLLLVFAVAAMILSVVALARSRAESVEAWAILVLAVGILVDALR